MVVRKFPAEHRPSALGEQAFARSEPMQQDDAEVALFYRAMYKPTEGMFCLPPSDVFSFGNRLKVRLPISCSMHLPSLSHPLRMLREQPKLEHQRQVQVLGR